MPRLNVGAVVLAAAIAVADVAMAAGYPTIVGRWYSPLSEGGSPRDCQSQWGWEIGPMSLGNAMIQCRFDDVARDGWEVTWHGQCSMEGQEIRGDAVVATENDETLTVRFGDGSFVSGLRRCPK